MKKSFILSLLYLFFGYLAIDGAHESAVPKLKALAEKAGAEVVLSMAQLPIEEREERLHQVERYLAPLIAKSLVPHLNLSWHHKQIQSPHKPERIIKIINGLRVLQNRPFSMCGDPNKHITELTFSRNPAWQDNQGNQGYALRATNRQGEMSTFAVEDGEKIAQEQLPFAPKKEPFRKLEDKCGAWRVIADKENVRVYENGAWHSTFQTPPTRTGKETEATVVSIHGEDILVGTSNGKVYKRKVSEQMTPQKVKRGKRVDSGHGSPINSLFITPRGKNLLSTSRTSLRLGAKSPTQNSEVKIARRLKGSFAKEVISNENGDIFAAHDQSLVVYDRDLERKETVPLPYYVGALEASPAGRHVALGTLTGSVEMLEHPIERVTSARSLFAELERKAQSEKK